MIKYNGVSYENLESAHKGDLVFDTALETRLKDCAKVEDALKERADFVNGKDSFRTLSNVFAFLNTRIEDGSEEKVLIGIDPYEALGFGMNIPTGESGMVGGIIFRPDYGWSSHT